MVFNKTKINMLHGASYYGKDSKSVFIGDLHSVLWCLNYNIAPFK